MFVGCCSSQVHAGVGGWWQGEHPLFDVVVEAATGRKRQRTESCCSSHPCQVLRLSSSGSLLCLFCFTCCLKLPLSLVHTDTAGVDVLHKGCHHLRGNAEFLLPIEEKRMNRAALMCNTREEFARWFAAFSQLMLLLCRCRHSRSQKSPDYDLD